MNNLSENEIKDVVKFLLKTDYFKKIPADELYNLAQTMKREKYYKDDIIFRENEEGDSFYIIEEGKVEIAIEQNNLGRKQLSVIGKSEGFGELSIIDKQRRSATVKCIEDTSLLVLSKINFEKLIKDENSFSSSLAYALTNIVRNNTEIIIKDLKDRNELLENSMSQLQELQDALVENERMIAVGRFANKMVHDLRNMLNQIFNATQLISVKREKSTDKSWNVKDYLRLIEEAVKKMNDMCTEVLEYSHGNISLETKRININEFLDEYIKKVRKTFESYDISLYTNIKSERIVDIDIDKLNRVLNNIIYNAVDALNKRENPYISINCYDNEKYNQIIIEIGDNGVGIPEQHLEKVFEPFFTHGKSYGTGLGLSISKDIITKYHKGSISIKSEEDKGTIVSISLPYC